MTWEVWATLGTVAILALVGTAFLCRRLPVYHWHCRLCDKIVSAGRFHPGRCTCGTNLLVAYFCRDCASWNTTPTSRWHCGDCASRNVLPGVEYHLVQAQWKWRNQEV